MFVAFDDVLECFINGPFGLFSRYKIDPTGVEVFQMFGVIHGCTAYSNLNLPALDDMLLFMTFGYLIYGQCRVAQCHR